MPNCLAGTGRRRFLYLLRDSWSSKKITWASGSATRRIPPGPSWAAAGPRILSQAAGLRPSPGVVSLPGVAAGMLRRRHSRPRRTCTYRVSSAGVAVVRKEILQETRRLCAARQVGGGVLRSRTLKREVNYRLQKGTEMFLSMKNCSG